MTDKINILILIACCLFLYFIGSASINLTDPDEVFYTGTAKEMLANKSLLTPLIFGKPQFEKPPLFYWMLMGSFKAFGINTFAARLVPALVGLIGVMGTYFFMRKISGAQVSFYAALFLSAAFLYFGLSKTVITDIAFSVFTAFALYSFYIWYRSRKDPYVALFMITLSLAVLTKGPLAVVLVFAAIIPFLFLAKGAKALPAFLLNRYWLIFLALGCGWFVYAVAKYGNEFVGEFFVRDNWHRIIYAEHRSSDRWYFYPAVVIGGMAPWTAYLLFLGKGFKEHRDEYLFFISWIVSTFLILTCAHSKLASYILPLFPALCCALAISVNSLSGRPKSLIAAGAVNILFGAAGLIASPFIAKEYPDLAKPFFLSLFLLFIFMTAGGVSLIKGRIKQAVFLNIAALAAFLLAGVSSVPAKLETAFSDHGLPEIVRKHGYEGKPIVCSKMYVRGVYFYTGNPVLVLNMGGKKPFWSDHPLDVLSTEAEAVTFFRDKDKVLCVLTEEGLEKINGFFGSGRRNAVISSNLDRVVVLSEKISPLK
ncbi:MAG: glycosyltransferase family 39 protein [Candidatus Omnitrophica bacterium]|nr:glycosyltransferase family 39 protein [Candidatus Omnitrophota bacterium]